MAYCELCDMDDSVCAHGYERRIAARERVAALRVAPSGKAHFDGCPHKGDEDDDYERWGVIDEEGAWQRLANREQISTTTSSGRTLVATSRCTTCVQHGPW
jgi:hypothetical protein